MDWNKARKIDAHIHILPEDKRLEFIKYQGEECTWGKAAELDVPVMYHSNPCRTGFHDSCAPDKINKMIKVFPDITFITAHMGGMKYLDAFSGCTWVDISFILPELVMLYGIKQTNRILRMFGSDRLIFGTDYPECNYEGYFSILNQTDFNEGEIEKILYGNIASIMDI